MSHLFQVISSCLRCSDKSPLIQDLSKSCMCEHKYIEETLRRYNFGSKFITYFIILFNVHYLDPHCIIYCKYNSFSSTRHPKHKLENQISDAQEIEVKKSKVSYVGELLNCPLCRIPNLDATSMTAHLFEKHGKQRLTVML